MKAKKSYGQHFLINENLAQNIAKQAIDLSEEFPVLEIGPGKGVLTKYLFEIPIQFKAVESDIDMIEYLHANFPGIDSYLIFEDILKIDLNSVFEGKQLVLFGNFPYNISSQILFKMIENKDLVPYMVGMFQREVAERILASPGNKDYGILSIMTQAYYEGKILYRIKPGSFNPPPKVDSAVIKLKRKEKFTLDCDENLFKTIVKTTFNHRRKMMRNTLKSMVKDPAILKNDIFSKRPEQLTIEDFVKLTNTIDNYNINK